MIYSTLVEQPLQPSLLNLLMFRFLRSTASGSPIPFAYVHDIMFNFIVLRTALLLLYSVAGWLAGCNVLLTHWTEVVVVAGIVYEIHAILYAIFISNSSLFMEVKRGGGARATENHLSGGALTQSAANTHVLIVTLSHP